MPFVHTMTRVAGLVAVLAVAIAVPPEGALCQDPQSSAVDAILEPYDLPDGPGGIVGVYLNGDVVYARGFGLANLEYGISNTPSTVFRVGSVSKQFTAMAVAILAQRGKLSLDDDIRKYLPEIPEYPEGVVTVRHLVHHTSGFRDYNQLAQLAGYRSDQLATTDATLELLARQRGLNFAPGERFLYSNSGYFLMAVLVERVTGRTLADFAREEIFEPLGMESSRFKDDHGAVVPNRAYGYVADEDGQGWRLYLSQRDFVGAGGVFTTVEDMLHWFVNLDHNRLGEPGLAELIHEVGVLNDGTELDYAFGLRLTEDRGLRLIDHSGSFAAFRAHSMRYPEQGLAVFTAVNGGPANPSRLAREIADVYLQRLIPGLGPPELPTRGGQMGPAVTAGEQDFEITNPHPYEGAYYGFEVDATYEVTVRDGGLELTMPGSGSGPLRPVAEGVFRRQGLTLRFRRSSAGDVTGFTLYGRRAGGLVFERTNRPPSGDSPTGISLR